MEWIPSDTLGAGQPTTARPLPDKDEEIDLSRVNVPGTRRDIEEVLRKQIALDVRRLVEMARSIGINPRMLPDLTCNCCDCKDPNRPNFGPMQVRHLCQIKKGLTYHSRSINTGNLYGVISILRGPYQAWRFCWMIDVEYLSYGKKKDGFALAGMSVVPYEGYPDKSDLWHQENFLEFATDSEHLAGPHKDHCSCCRHHYREGQK